MREIFVLNKDECLEELTGEDAINAAVDMLSYAYAPDSVILDAANPEICLYDRLTYDDGVQQQTQLVANLCLTSYPEHEAIYGLQLKIPTPELDDLGKRVMIEASWIPIAVGESITLLAQEESAASYRFGCIAKVTYSLDPANPTPTVEIKLIDDESQFEEI